MSPRRFLRAIKKAGLDIDRKHLLAFSSSLAYYYFLSLLPLLILIASALAYIPIPHLFDQVLLWMAYFVPADSIDSQLCLFVIWNCRYDLDCLGRASAAM